MALIGLGTVTRKTTVCRKSEWPNSRTLLRSCASPKFHPGMTRGRFVDLEIADFRVLAWLKGRVKTSERLEDAAMRAAKGRRAVPRQIPSGWKTEWFFTPLARNKRA
jgi:hypothetical protein